MNKATNIPAHIKPKAKVCTRTNNARIKELMTRADALVSGALSPYFPGAHKTDDVGHRINRHDASDFPADPYGYIGTINYETRGWAYQFCEMWMVDYDAQDAFRDIDFEVLSDYEVGVVRINP
jgi:hypothetical protein